MMTKVQPIFRGSIESIDLTNGGVGYGSSDIIDFVRQPEVTFESGTGAKLTPIINNGKIVDVIVNIPGSGYNSPPDLNIISDTGDYAILVPIISNGQIEKSCCFKRWCRIRGRKNDYRRNSCWFSSKS